MHMAISRFISLLSLALVQLAAAAEESGGPDTIVRTNPSVTSSSESISNLQFKASIIGDAIDASAHSTRNDILKPCITRDQIERCRSLADKCSPEERTIVIRKWRDHHGGITNRLHLILENLRLKKAKGRISESELTRLMRLETVAQRFKETRLEKGKPPNDITPKN